MAKTVHWIKEYYQGDVEVPTYCGMKISTWHDDPNHEISGIETDLSCPFCMQKAIAYLRPALNKLATEHSKCLAKRWDEKLKKYKMDKESAKR